MDADPPVSARVPADVEAPDKIFYGFTARQVAVVAAAVAVVYLGWQLVGARIPLPVFAVVAVPVVAVAAAVAVGHRDGVTLDAWLWAAIRYRRGPHRLVPAPGQQASVPAWAPHVHGDPSPVGVLRLPAHAIDDSGVIDLGADGTVVLVAATTVNIGLRTSSEQAGLVGGYGRWLNSLTGPVQVVVSARRVDLASHAQRVVDAARTLPHPALADAAVDYADFLLDIAADRDPLSRTVTIACAAPAVGGGRAEALRRAEHTAAALSGLGCRTRVLDGPTAAAVVAAAADPYAGVDAGWPRATPGTPITARPPVEETP
ncbi:PrgI family protein [Polymorphospora rubra]|uniref:PrgI family protein n=1 Tax=Polymorphospora rubra TaxID=338584 RepID=UPI0033F114AC